MANMASARWKSLLIAVHNDQPPSDAEWNAYMALLRAFSDELRGDALKIHSLVITDGGAPDASQRNQLREVLGGKTITASIVSDSLVVRSIIGFLSIFIGGGKVFAPADWKGACLRVLNSYEVPTELVTLLSALSAQVGQCRSLSNFFAEHSR
jgi:hypothetical protein